MKPSSSKPKTLELKSVTQPDQNLFSHEQNQFIQSLSHLLETGQAELSYMLQDRKIVGLSIVLKTHPDRELTSKTP